MQSKSTPWVAYIMLLFLGASILACIKPRQRRPDQPPIQQQEPEANNPTAQQEPAKPKPAPKPLILAERTKEEDACDKGNNPSCHSFSREALKQAKRDPELKARAAMSMYQACTNADGDACYVYGLMVWLRSGMAYDPAEISWAFQQGRALGSMHAKVGNKELIKPASMGQAPNKNTLYHYKQACDWGLQIACGAYAVHNGNNNSVLPQPPTAQPKAQPQPEQPPVSKAKPVTKPEGPKTKDDVTAAIEATPAEKTTLKEMMSGPKPMIADRGLKVRGGLSMVDVATSLKTRRTQLLYCYEREQLKNASLKGSIVLSMTVNASGGVVKTSFKGSTLPSKRAIKCMDKLAKLWRFDPPQNPQMTEIVYTAEFGKNVKQ